jgi:hypothetical protein
MTAAVVSKARAAGESALRTALQAAIPAFGASLYAADGNYGKAVLLGALTAAAAAGLAAVARVVKPIQTDRAGVGVQGVTPAPTPDPPTITPTEIAKTYPPPPSAVAKTYPPADKPR